MRSLLFLTFFLTCVHTAILGQSQQGYARVKIDLQSAPDASLTEAAIDVEHGIYVPSRFFITDLGEWEIERVRNLGFTVDVLIEDVSAYYRSERAQRNALTCQQFEYDYQTPEHFSPGSMGGHLTYEELLDALDLMALTYPGLITTRQQAGTDLTHQGRMIHWVRISDNPDVDEEEPEILYTALHHAREPVSMMQMMYFMWYLLENYGKNEEITYLVDNTELYFIPCVNPDGYVYNHSIAPDGGGMWRKNMRDNDENDLFTEKDDGVDINRNYGFQWGLDDEGSSGFPGSLVYRGPAPFSEPETRAVRDFVQEHNFLLALNYHAFGNFIIYPWGFDGSINPDSTAFRNYGSVLSNDNGYDYGTSFQTLGYLVNGVAADWMYSEHGIMALTPEIGDEYDGFWPAESSIIPLAQANLRKNLALAHLAHKFAVASDINNTFLTSRDGTLDIEVVRYGLEGGPMALSVESISPELQIQGSVLEVGFANFSPEMYTYNYSLSSEAEQGSTFGLVIRLDNGFFEARDTIYKNFVTEEVPFADYGDEPDMWLNGNSGTWGTTDEAAFSGTTSLTDSPYDVYPPSTENTFTTLEPVDLRNVLSAQFEFSARWEIEEIIDYAMVQISTDGVAFINLCGRYSKPGSIFQQTGEPIYDGFQDAWVHEKIDLDAFIGEQVYLRFVLVSDSYFEMDGIYIDDILVTVYDEDETVSSFHPLLPEDFTFAQYPNPASDFVRVQVDLTSTSFAKGTLQLCNSLGQVVASQNIDHPGLQTVVLHTADLPSGIYLTRLLLDGTPVYTDKLVRLH